MKRFTSDWMCASPSSPHPSICADDERGSIFLERSIQMILQKLKTDYTEHEEGFGLIVICTEHM